MSRVSPLLFGLLHAHNRDSRRSAARLAAGKVTLHNERMELWTQRRLNVGAKREASCLSGSMNAHSGTGCARNWVIIRTTPQPASRPAAIATKAMNQTVC